MDVDVEGQGLSPRPSENVSTAQLPLPAPLTVSATASAPRTHRGSFSATQGVASLRQSYDDDENDTLSVTSSSGFGAPNGLTTVISSNPSISGPAPTRDGLFNHYQRDPAAADIPLPPLRPHSRPSSPRVRGEPAERQSLREVPVAQLKVLSPPVPSTFDGAPTVLTRSPPVLEPTPTGNVTSNINKLLNDYPAPSPGGMSSSSPYGNHASGDRERHRSGSNASGRA